MDDPNNKNDGDLKNRTTVAGEYDKTTLKGDAEVQASPSVLQEIEPDLIEEINPDAVEALGPTDHPGAVFEQTDNVDPETTQHDFPPMPPADFSVESTQDIGPDDLETLSEDAVEPPAGSFPPPLNSGPAPVGPHTETVPHPFANNGGSKVPVIFAVVAILACLGLGFYTWNLFATIQEKDEQIAAANAETSELSGAVQQAEEDGSAIKSELEKTQKDLGRAQSQRDALKDKLDRIAKERKGIEDQLKEFKRFTEQFKKMIDAGRLKVTFRGGRMMLQLPAAVLFPLGSAELSEDGQKTIKDVARVLRKVRNRRFLIAGHTDNVKIVSDQWESNWQLSTARAVTVTQALLKAKINPGQLGAAGFADTDPVASNLTKNGRQQNRRIEIIVETKLPKIPDVDKDQAKSKKKKSKSKKRSVSPRKT